MPLYYESSIADSTVALNIGTEIEFTAAQIEAITTPRDFSCAPYYGGKGRVVRVFNHKHYPADGKWEALDLISVEIETDDWSSVARLGAATSVTKYKTVSTFDLHGLLLSELTTACKPLCYTYPV